MAACRGLGGRIRLTGRWSVLAGKVSTFRAYGLAATSGSGETLSLRRGSSSPSRNVSTIATRAHSPARWVAWVKLAAWARAAARAYGSPGWALGQPGGATVGSLA